MVVDGHLDQLQAQDAGCLGDAQVRGHRAHHPSGARQVSRGPQRRQVRQRRAGQQMPAAHPERRRQPADHQRLELPGGGRGVGVQQVLVHRSGPHRRSPGHPRCRRVHVREEARVVQPAHLLQSRALQMLQCHQPAEPDRRPLLRDIERQCRIDVGTACFAADLDQHSQRLAQPVGVGREVLLVRHDRHPLPQSGRWSRRGPASP